MHQKCCDRQKKKTQGRWEENRHTYSNREYLPSGNRRVSRRIDIRDHNFSERRSRVEMEHLRRKPVIADSRYDPRSVQIVGQNKVGITTIAIRS